MTMLYSILHMLVDGICAIAMFGWFSSGEHGYLNILLYNFCAFAMQMPLGAELDILNTRGVSGKRAKEREISEREVVGQEKYLDAAFWYAAVGIAMTILGSFLRPVVLGLGNALFHLGGGVDVIYEDQRKGKQGQSLGVFVAPGALGLYLGSLAAKKWESGLMCGVLRYSLLFLAIVMLSLFFWLVLLKKKETRWKDIHVQTDRKAVNPLANRREIHKKDRTVLLCCLIVVILRSYVGMAVQMPWKTTMLLGTLSIGAVVLGKMAGGFLAARLGIQKVITASLFLAAFCYLFCDHAIPGWLALFFFNMTMPITLYLLVCRFCSMPGFSFGLLTFGLFLGFLPVYFEADQAVFVAAAVLREQPVSGRLTGVTGSILGTTGSLISLILLNLAVRKWDPDNDGSGQSQ